LAGLKLLTCSRRHCLDAGADEVDSDIRRHGVWRRRKKELKKTVRDGYWKKMDQQKHAPLDRLKEDKFRQAPTAANCAERHLPRPYAHAQRFDDNYQALCQERFWQSY